MPKFDNPKHLNAEEFQKRQPVVQPSTPTAIPAVKSKTKKDGTKLPSVFAGVPTKAK